jgi:phage protein D
MINQLPQAAQGRTPRSILMVGGKTINWTGWCIEHNGIYEAGTIRITVPAPYAEWPMWTQQTEIIVDVYAGFPSDPDNYSIADLTLLMSARIDELRLDPATATFTLSGRDLTSLFIDNKNDAKYPNMTSSQIAVALAAKFQALQTNITPTTQLVGNYYDADQVQMQHQDSMWTLLTYLAQREGMQCFVLGRTLHFGSFGSAVSNAPYAIVFQAPTATQPYPSANAEKLEFSHDLTISGDVSVRVRSYHGARNASYSATATSTKADKTIAQSATMAQTAQAYDFTFPGLTQADCQAKATRLLGDISKHELKMEVTTPGDVQVFPWTPVTVQGTGTGFDTTYQVSKICRTFDKRGFMMNMSCRTAPSQQTVTLS